MVGLLAALLLAPWAHPLGFRPLPGWQRGASGNTKSAYVGHGRRAQVPLESTAWIARHVRYRDDATADPPNQTLKQIPANGVIVWATIFSPPETGERRVELDLSRARRVECCEGEYVAGGEYELTGVGPGGTYSVIVRIYFGSRPTRPMRTEAQRALARLELPPPRW